jgi:hyperosmotically inducible periplasmic protein
MKNEQGEDLMIINRSLLSGSALLMCFSAVGIAQTTPPAPDNSKANASSMNSTSTMGTADAQKNDAADMAITQNIRKSVMADKSLSTYAHNVKIVTVNGAVTLNGVVRDTREKGIIEMKAQEIAGKTNVTDALSIAPPK